MSNHKLPIDVQAFDVMRGENYVYVDKTHHIARMLDEGRNYFLSRPRRFGKSLFVSTLRCLFEGRKELFEGLWFVEHAEWNWEEHPVISLSFNELSSRTPEVLENSLNRSLEEIAESYGVQLQNPLLELRFRELIVTLYQKIGMPVAVLIDEYDKPIIDYLGKGTEGIAIATANRDLLKSFFGVLKGNTVSPILRFVFLTGISRFSKVSIFSELNNLIDLTMDEKYADMLGYTQEELENCFQEEIEQLALASRWTIEQVKNALAQHYNGYRFSERNLRVYNPFSILRCFHNQKFHDYWFESATPSFLIRLLQQEQYAFAEIENLEMLKSMTTYNLEQLFPEVLLFQTGYVTIKEVRDSLYILDYPNREVKQAFVEHILFAHTDDIHRNMRSPILQLPASFLKQDFEAFFQTIQAIFASIPYDIETKRDEAYFHTLFYLMMTASGMAAQSSVLTCDGRIDLLVRSPDAIVIVEFKCNQSAETAIRQIQEKGYADPYRASGKKIVSLGINFDTETRNITEWKSVT